MYITNSTTAPQVLVRSGHDDWALTEINNQDGPYLSENSTATTITPSGTSGSITLTASADLWERTDVFPGG